MEINRLTRRQVTDGCEGALPESLVAQIYTGQRDTSLVEEFTEHGVGVECPVPSRSVTASRKNLQELVMASLDVEQSRGGAACRDAVPRV